MLNRPLEEKLRERLGQHPTPLDTDALWDKIEPSLPKKRERVLPIWIWSISGLALLISLLFWYYGRNSDLVPIAVGETPEVIALEEIPAPETSETTSIIPNPDSPVEEVRPKNTTEVITSGNESPVLLLQPATAPAAAPEKNGDPAAAFVLANRNSVTVANQQLLGEGEKQSLPEADWPITPEDQPEPTPAASARPTMKIPALAAAIVPLESEFALVIPPTAAAEVRPEEVADPVGKQPGFDEREVARRAAVEVRQTEASKKAAAKADITALKAKRMAEREAAKRVAKLARQAEVEQKTAEKAAADKALAEVKAQRAAEKKAARLAQTEMEQAEENRRAKERLETQKVIAAAKPQPRGKMERIRARNIEQDRQLAEKRTERLAAAQQSAREAENKEDSQVSTKQLKEEAKRIRKDSENQRLAAQFEARNKEKADRRRALEERYRAQRAERAAKAREWLAKRDMVSPKEEQKAFQKKLEAEAREKRLAFEKEEKERDLKVQEILKRNRKKYSEADRAARLALARQRRADRLTRNLASAERRQAEKEARDNQRALAKAEKPKKIDNQRPAAYWSVEAGLALSLPLRTISGGGEQGRINETYEKILEGISLQGLVGHHRPSGFSLRTGLVSSRINSKVETEVTTQGFDEESAVVAIIVSPDGSRQPQVGTVRVANETVTKTKYYNAVNSLDVPLLLGYRFQGSKFGLTLEAGPTFNLSSGGNAHLYDGNGGYREAEGGHFRQKLTGLGALANIGGAYNLSGNTMLTANLRIQSFGGGGFENVDVSGYSTQFTLIGVQLGYRIKF